MDVELIAVTVDHKHVLTNLLQLYLHDFSEIRPVELSADGRFDYPWLNAYFNAPEREAYLITSAGQLAGFAMIRSDVENDEGVWNVSEFFVVRGHRRRGVAREAARQLFRQHPGVWTLAYLHENGPAARLWPAVAEGVADRTVIRVDQYPPEVSAATASLRFQALGKAGRRGVDSADCPAVS